MAPRGLDSLAAAGAKSRPRWRHAGVAVQPFRLQEVAMKTVITSASTDLPSRFSKALGH
jgi:hypothetical protein